MNGDVVFDPDILEMMMPYIKRDESFITVDVSSVSDEEVKYTTDADGKILELSKSVPADVAQARLSASTTSAPRTRRSSLSGLLKSMTRTTSRELSS